MAIIEKRKLLLVILLVLMVSNPAYSQSNNQNLVQGAPITIFPGSTQIGQLGCRFDRTNRRMAVVFVDLGLFPGPSLVENEAANRLDASVLEKRSCAVALTRLAAAGFSERSVTRVGDIQVHNLLRFNRIFPIPIPLGSTVQP